GAARAHQADWHRAAFPQWAVHRLLPRCQRVRMGHHGFPASFDGSSASFDVTSAHSKARSVRRCVPWMADHTLAGVNGMSACLTPYGLSASITALTTAAGDPTVADSPTPLAPIGWCGHGVTVSPSCQDGHSIEVGSR